MVSNRFPIKTLSNILLATQVLYWISQFRGTKLREFIGIRLCWYENLCRCSSKVWKYCRYRARFQDRQPAVTFQTCGANPGNFSGEPIRNGIWKVGFMLNIGILGLTISITLYSASILFHIVVGSNRDFPGHKPSPKTTCEEKTSSWAECLIEECSKEGCRRMENWVYRKEHADDYQVGWVKIPCTIDDA